MKALRFLGGAIAASVLAFGGASAQQPGDATRMSADSALTGEQVTLTLEVLAPAGSTVEPDPANASWNGVEIVRIGSVTSAELGDSTLHTLELVVTGFTPGERAFQPAVFVVLGTESSSRLLPAAELTIIPTLSPGDPLEISPIAPPVSIGGEQSPLLWPAVAVGGLVAAGVAGLVITWAARRMRRAQPAPVEAVGIAAPTLAAAEALIERDTVTAYRTLAATVREVLGLRYGFPARALTTNEMDRRMLLAGVDRWQARLVTGLLEECDAVVYAGYRPAAERRQADLTMAREIVEAG